ncbi:hypothetical protein [Sphingomonas panni]|uniref:hypothetical protein n=1 Tax=Sphingomonas panni TaxID=237612 RepID=UPI001F5B6108|nr:hypothetical protein [Sphingomonas panni]
MRLQCREKDFASGYMLVDIVQSGPIVTDVSAADSQFAGQIVQAIPLGRYGRVEEIGAITFLASPIQ